MRSLRQRAILGGFLWAGASVSIGGIALFSLFDTIAQQRFDQALRDRHLQVVAALDNSGADPEIMESYITDAAYQRPYSGRYWQILGADRTILVSRSLFDVLLDEHDDASNTADFWVGSGPNGRVRAIQQLVSLDDGSDWTVTVAESLNSLEAERAKIRQGLLATFALVGVLGIAGAVLQTSAVVRPLTKLREDVSRRWDSSSELNPADYPVEVAPLATDINTLLDRNREIIHRARRQAADLAHALKTPSTVLRNELDILAMENVDVAQASEALDRVDAQLLRSLARIRAGNSAATTHAHTNLGDSVERMVRLFRSMQESTAKTLESDSFSGLVVPLDIQDLEEVLGNNLENAFKWAQKRVQICNLSDGNIVRVAIEDDGPGIPENSRREALKSGGRLDVSVPGTGLGLAIATDLLHAYGGDLELGHSEKLGGLRVLISMPLTSV